MALKPQATGFPAEICQIRARDAIIPGDSAVNQLLHLYHEFVKALDQQKEIRVIFFDITKAFDRVWHNGLLAKLEAKGVQAQLSGLTSYLNDWHI